MIGTMAHRDPLILLFPEDWDEIVCPECHETRRVPFSVVPYAYCPDCSKKLNTKMRA